MRSKNNHGTSALAIFLMMACFPWVTPEVSAATEATTNTLHFPVTSYRIEGPPLISAGTVQRILCRYTGPRCTLAEIEAARAALQRAYADAGYNAVMVFLPAQKLQSGVVLFRLNSPHIGAIHVAGGPYYDRANVLRSLPALVVGEIPNMRDINAELALANENPSKYTTVQLSRGEEPGTITANAAVKGESPWRTFLTLNNTGNPQTGTFLLGVGMQYANVANRDQVLTLQYTTAPGHIGRVNAYGIGYSIPFYRLDGSLNFFAGYTNINAGTVGQVFNVTGKGLFMGLHYDQHLQSSRHYQQELTYGLDYTAYRNNISFLGTPIGNNVTVHPLSLTYSGRYIGRKSSFSARLSAVQNIPWGANGGSRAFALNRVGANPDYHLLRLYMDYRQMLWGQWEFRMFSDGQFTTNALVPGAQFGLGGLHSVRGFYDREYTGDSGIQGTVEVYSPSFSRSLGLPDASLRALAFYDSGWAWLNDSQPGDTPYLNISSAGVGLDLVVARNLSFKLDYARILRAGNFGPSTHNRVQGSLAIVF